MQILLGFQFCSGISESDRAHTGPVSRSPTPIGIGFHSVDRPSICRALAKEIESQKRRPQLFVQVNTGEEPQKAGVKPSEVDAFIASCRDNYGLAISGLMCIPPVNEAPAPHFALTAKIAARNDLKQLSMGMSADFAIAIQFGATHVRVGSAIFGSRH